MPEGGFQLALSVLADAHEAKEEIVGLVDKLKSGFEDLIGVVTKFELSLDALTGAGAAVAGMIAGVEAAIVALGVHGSEVDDVTQGFQRLAGGVGQANAVLAAMRSGVAGTIDDLTLMKDANHLLAVGAVQSADDFKTMTEASRVLSREGFGSMQDMMEKVNRAMEMGRANRLQMIGVTVDTKASEEAYATSLGKTVADLTTAEKKIADRQAIMAALSRTVKDAGDQELSFSEKLSQMKVAVENGFNALSQAVATSQALGQVLDRVGDGFKDLFGRNQTEVINTIVLLIEQFAIHLIVIGLGALQVAGIFNVAWNAIKELVLGTSRVVVEQLETWMSSLASLSKISEALGAAPPGTTKALNDMKKSLDDTRISLKGMEDEAAKGVAGQNEFGKTLGELGGNLFNVRDALSKAADEQEKFRDFLVKGGPAVSDFTGPVQQLKQHMTDAAGETSKFGQAVQALVQQLEGDSKKTKEEQAAIDQVIKSRTTDIDTIGRVIDMMDGLLKKHITLTAAEQAYHDKNEQFGAAEKKLIEEIDALKQKALVAEQERDMKGIALSQAKLDAQEAAEIKKLQDEAVRMPQFRTQIEEKISAVQQEFAAKREKADVDLQTKENDEIQVLRDKDLAAQNEYNLRGLDLTLSRIDAQQQAELNQWDTKLKNGQVEEWAYDEALYEIDQKFALQKQQAIDKDNEDTIQKLKDLEAQYNQIVDTEVGNTVKAKLDANQKWLDDTKHAYIIAHGYDHDYFDALDKLAAAKADQIIHENDPIRNAWKNLNTDMRQTWADTWEKALDGTGSFVDALTSPWKEMEARWKKLMAAMAADWEQQLLSKLGFNVPGLTGGGFGGAGSGGENTFNPETNQFMIAPGNLSEGGGGVGMGVGMGIASGVTAGMGTGSVGSKIGQVGESAAIGGVGAGVMAGSIGAGIAVGAATMGIGLAVIGAIYAIRAMMADKGADIMRDVGSQFGTNISESLRDTIKSDVEDNGWSEQAAEINHLNDIIKEAGGLTDKNLPEMTARFRDLFSMIETGQMSVANGTALLDQNWQQFAAAGTAADGRLSDSLKEIIQLNERFGTQSQQIAQYLQQQSSNAAAGFNALAAGVLDANNNLAVYDKLKADVDAATASGQGLNDALAAQKTAADAASGGLNDLGIQAVASYTAMVASGHSETESLAAIHPALQNIQKAYSDLGISTDDAALKALMFKDKVATAAPEMANAVAGLNQEMIALDNMGLMNTTTFSAMERSGQTMFERLNQQVHDLGGTDADTLGQMQEYLHEAQTEAKNLGVPLDDNTQKMIDQSVKLGIWQTTGTSATDKLTEGMQTLVDKVGELIDRLNGVKTKTADAANATKTAADDMTAAWKGVSDAVDQTNFGHSPGGLKEIPLLLAQAQAAFTSTGDVATGVFSKISDNVDTLTVGGSPLQKITDTGFGLWKQSPYASGSPTDPMSDAVFALNQIAQSMSDATQNGGDLHVALNVDGAQMTKTVIQNIRYNKGSSYTLARGALGLPS